MSIYDITVTKADGTEYTLNKYEGAPMLIVNTATNCGLKGQFDGLESLYQKYKDDGLVVLGFPSNQFKQVLDDAAEAEESCRLNYGVTFPIHDIVQVNGSSAHPLFQLLTDEQKGIFGSQIKWNFTKFLVDREGNVVNRFSPQTKPEGLEDDIQSVVSG
ncbi:glutathione peroxidase [Salibacterium halotolerans]|uniref:Glutathione peroxidase n=1 Tax=Salibacterium halotolerans TaxID=1884432 RepID=A0A1I5W210_9BACI|nr:glutathione peroxidase [Salibacterium halotolerans]SFQ13296.1 glutathione peroxidase [Salibacterium halotolerans]